MKSIAVLFLLLAGSFEFVCCQETIQRTKNGKETDLVNGDTEVHPFSVGSSRDTSPFEINEQTRGSQAETESAPLKHWTESTYGVPWYNASEWTDPLTDISKPYIWLSDSEMHSKRITLEETPERADIQSEGGKRRKLLLGIRLTLGLGSVKNTGPSMATVNGSYYRWDSVQPPASVDWRQTDAITVVKSQGQCSSCWALAAADTISMMWAIRSGAAKRAFNASKATAAVDPQFAAWGTFDASPQEICDCGFGSCCQAGWPEWAFNYVLANGGVSSWQSYPYFQTDGNCSAGLKDSKVAKITGWELVPARSLEAAKKAVTQQPFLALVSGSSLSFQNYSGGFYDGDCGDELDHVVVVVGYGTSSQFGPYWIIKNSWGTIWGDNGYMYLKMEPGKGKCSILASPGLYPTYYPTATQDPCGALPNPCGAGKCVNTISSVALLQLSVTVAARCVCPSGFVENTQTNPPKCVKADPCAGNPNPCGAGNCTSLKDGSFACSCPAGFFAGSTSMGAPTCVAAGLLSGLSTVTAVLGTTVQTVASALNVALSSLLSLNGWVDPNSYLPAGAAIAINTTANMMVCSTVYMAQIGDTCATIAYKYGLTSTALQANNPIIKCSSLLPGSEICVYKTKVPQTSNVPTCGQLYEVQAGDTCASVKLKKKLSDAVFVSLNPGVKCDKPLDQSLVLCTAQWTGPTLNCTKYIRVQHGDSCPSIWLSANLTFAQFSLLNPGVRCNAPYFQVGQPICVESPLLANLSTNIIPYYVQQGDNLDSIAQDFYDRCGSEAAASSICTQNRLTNCADPSPGTYLQIPCRSRVGRSCGCDDNYDPYFGSDGVWYQNYCSAVCNFALPAVERSNFCKRACMYRAGLNPYNDPDRYCNAPCPWPQWNPQPSNWWWVAKTFSDYYVGACKDWCISSANTIARARNDWDNWSRYYNDCVSACRRGKV